MQGHNLPVRADQDGKFVCAVGRDKLRAVGLALVSPADGGADSVSPAFPVGAVTVEQERMNSTSMEGKRYFFWISNAERTDHSLACLTRADLARAQGDLDSARGFYLKSLALTEALPLLPYPLEGLAKLNVLHAQADRAARLFGAAHALRQRMEVPLPPVECGDYEKHLNMTKKALGKKVFTSAWKEGEGMSVEELVGQDV